MSRSAIACSEMHAVVPDELNLLVLLVKAVRIFNDTKQCNAPGASSTKTPPTNLRVQKASTRQSYCDC